MHEREHKQFTIGPLQSIELKLHPDMLKNKKK